MLSAAKHLAADRGIPFAALSVTPKEAACKTTVSCTPLYPSHLSTPQITLRSFTYHPFLLYCTLFSPCFPAWHSIDLFLVVNRSNLLHTLIGHCYSRFKNGTAAHTHLWPEAKHGFDGQIFALAQQWPTRSCFTQDVRER